MIWRIRECWMTWLRKGECSRQTAQHKKKISDQASACLQGEGRWKYQKMSIVGRLACRFSENQSSSHKQSSRDNYNREGSLYCICKSMGKWGRQFLFFLLHGIEHGFSIVYSDRRVNCVEQRNHSWAFQYYELFEIELTITLTKDIIV